MKIQNLDEAEAIVANSKSLSWEGWDIIHLTQDNSAEYDVRGVYDKGVGKWFRRISYPYINGTGWDIPNSLLRG